MYLCIYEYKTSTIYTSYGKTRASTNDVDDHNDDDDDIVLNNNFIQSYYMDVVAVQKRTIKYHTRKL